MAPRALLPLCSIPAWVVLSLFFLGANLVNAQDLSIRQRILMPGPLTAAHADLETECGNCHQSFEKQEMTALCLGCHEDVASDRASGSGFHGKSNLAAGNACETCHKDHEGRDADIIGLARESFNHALTDFPLSGVHSNLACASCHTDDQKFRETVSSCHGCHATDDVHGGALGEQCETCHQATSWLDRLPFDHDSTDFPLKGLHEGLSCNSCHVAQQFEFESTQCIDCHRTADVHLGANGTECASCHTEQGWDVVKFNHDDTAFPLLGVHADTPCAACHLPDQDRKDAPTTCNGCHASDDAHFGRNGTQCESCHVSTSWTNVRFDHNRDTDYLLTGKHLQLPCTQCHVGNIHDSLSRECFSCHAADDVHHDPGMTQCSSCHNTQNWKSTTSFDHDFTSFPLIGLHQVVPCASCHIGSQFSSTSSDCASCHAFDDIHEGSLGESCAQCHTPNAWNLWQFDHLQFTGYPLEGAHENLACDSCHLPGSEPEDTPKVCGSCHQNQDIHNGGFGLQCNQCHGTSNFFELLIR